MSAIGSLVFCTDCGNLLETSTGNANTILICECCGAENQGNQHLSLFSTTERANKLPHPDTASKVITTETKAASFPSLLRQKRSAIQTVDRTQMTNEASIQMACPECGNPEMTFYTVQLRSADEGSTVFYSCPKCGHK